MLYQLSYVRKHVEHTGVARDRKKGRLPQSRPV